MKRIYGLVLSICIALAGVSAMFYAISNSSVMAMQPEAIETTIVVNTLEDVLKSDGYCSLREAITAANDNVATDVCPAGNSVITDTITFEVTGTITVTSHLPVTAGGPLVIDGGGVMTISGGGSTAIAGVVSGAYLALEGLTLVDGWGGLYGNGGILNDGTLEIINCTLFGNSGGYGGGILNDGILTVTNSAFSSNSAQYGGGINNTYEGIATIMNSTFLGNSVSPSGSASSAGGAIVNGGTLTITNSTLSDNSAEGGGGIANTGTLTVTNSTLSGNSAGSGGAILNNDKLTVIGSTLSGNSGGGIFNGMGQVTVSGSIIANSANGDNCAFDPITDGGFNLEDTDTCGFDPSNGSLINTDPLLGPLQDNGGSTFTQALLEGSPAIDAGDPVNCPTSDQRGVPRPIDGDVDGTAVCDIGSYEYEVPVSGLVASNDSPTKLGTPTTFTATVEGGTNISYAWDFGDDTAGEGAVVTHTYSAVGVYTATVTASNSTGSVQASTVVDVVIPETRVYLPQVQQQYSYQLEERAALMELFNHTDGWWWYHNTGWGTDSSYCDWYGVTCDENEHVTILDLDRNWLNGTIPPEIGNLPKLTVLRLTGSESWSKGGFVVTYTLDGPIPPEIGNLANLQELDLYGNELTFVPPEIGNLASLQYLNLEVNRLNSLPTEIGNLASLQHLGLADNQLVGFIPAFLSNLGNLISLYLYGNPDLTCWETQEARDWALSLEYYWGPTCYLP